jgi:phenylacetate-CoA ligase
MGVHIDTSVCLSEPSVRSDMAIALLKKIGHQFEQIIIIGDPWFLKSLVEYGVEKNIDWQALNVSFVSGQDYFPESFRDYLCYLTNLDMENDPVRTYITSMGLAEAGYNVFHETRETMRIRRAATRNPTLKKKLFDAPQVACPYLLNYYPFVTYLEDYQEKGDDLILFSTINNDRAIPVMRYKPNDCGRIISFNQLSEILEQNNLSSLIPTIMLPCVTVSGRKSSYIIYENLKLYSEDIKLAIYEDFEFAWKITGYFRLELEGKKPIVKVQLKEGIKPNGQDNKIAHQIINKYMPVEIDTKLYAYPDFPYGMELNYEKKFLTTAQK